MSSKRPNDVLANDTKSLKFTRITYNLSPRVVNLQIISKEGGLLLKDNFEGGATWAYEVGSQSMVCPIIVEDLNQPRQMLVEVRSSII